MKVEDSSKKNNGFRLQGVYRDPVEGVFVYPTSSRDFFSFVRRLFLTKCFFSFVRSSADMMFTNYLGARSQGIWEYHSGQGFSQKRLKEEDLRKAFLSS